MVDVAALLIFLFPLAYSPGPGNLFFAAHGARGGLASVTAAMVSYHVATFLVTLAVGFGFVHAATAYGAFLDILRPVGAAYVIWLGIRLARAGRTDEGTCIQGRPGVAEGALLLLLNPKAWMIIASMFATFLDGDRPADASRVLAISTIFTANNLVAFMLWTVAGERLRRMLDNERRARIFNLVMGLMLVAVGLTMFLDI
ncbi:MAG: LysE family translocator [Geminicoccaceae bacterium]